MSEPSKLTAYFAVRRMLQNAPMERGPVERNVLLLMAGWADPDGTKIIQSYDSISAVTGFSKSAVRLAVDFWITLEVLILVKRGGGRGHAPEYAIDLTKVETFITADKGAAPEHLSDNKGAAEEHLSSDGKVLPEATKGTTKVQKGAVERHPPSLPSSPLPTAPKNHHAPDVVESSDGDRFDDYKKIILAKCKDDSEGTLSTVLDIIIDRARQSGVNPSSPNYLEAALDRFNFQEGQDREAWMAARRMCGRPSSAPM
jgi:hypothetical protein